MIPLAFNVRIGKFIRRGVVVVARGWKGTDGMREKTVTAQGKEGDKNVIYSHMTAKYSNYWVIYSK